MSIPARYGSLRFGKNPGLDIVKHSGSGGLKLGTNMNENDFDIQWYSGTGKGGQHRNKHQNCCRVIHRETGISANGTNSRSREDNKRAAMSVCTARVAAALHEDTERYQAGFERVRTYHGPNNRVTDHASGLAQTYKEVVEKGDLSQMIAARLKAKTLNGENDGTL